MNFIDNIYINNEKDIICLTNSEGIHFYDTNDFQLLMKLNPLRIGLYGDVNKTKIFYNSQIIAFSILETKEIPSEEQLIIFNNSNIKRNSIVLYDLNNYEIIGKITLKSANEINDFLITRFFIIIMIENKNKTLLFKTSNLEYFKTISNIDHGNIFYSDDYFFNKRKKNHKGKNLQYNYQNKMNKCIIVYKDSINSKLIARIQFIFNEDKTKVIGSKTRNTEINLNSDGIKNVGLISSFYIVSSIHGNKIHIYDLLSGELKYCLVLGNFPYEITEVHLDNKQKIISIITNNKYLKLYKLNRLSSNCICNLHFDENISFNEERGMLDKLKHKIGIGRSDYLCRFKININSFDLLYNKTLIAFDKKSNDFIYVIQLNKNIKKLKFNRKKSEDMIIMEEITLPSYSINEKCIKKNEDKNNINNINNRINLILNKNYRLDNDEDDS